MRGPCFPCARCPAEISSRLAGLDGQAEGAAHTSTAGPPGNPGKTGTAAAPSLPLRLGPGSALPVAVPAVPAARQALAQGSGLRPSPPRAGGEAGPCCAGEAWLPRCIPEPSSLPASPTGRVTRFPQGRRHPVPVPPEPAPPPPLPHGAASSAQAQPSAGDERALAVPGSAGGSSKVTPRRKCRRSEQPVGTAEQHGGDPCTRGQRARRASAPSGLIPTGQGEERGGTADS